MLPLPRHVPLSVDSMIHYYSMCITSSSCYLISSIIFYVYTHIQFICVLFFICVLCIYWKIIITMVMNVFVKILVFIFAGWQVMVPSPIPQVMLYCPCCPSYYLLGLQACQKMFCILFSRCKDSSHVFTLAGQAEFHWPFLFFFQRNNAYF